MIGVSSASGFTLHKWYADCTTGSGELLICYVATLAAGPLRLRYAASLELDAPGARLRQRASLRGGRVDAAEGSLALSSRALGLAGTWTGGTATSPVVVAESGAGRVEWQGLALDAAASVDRGGRRFRGVGYAEVVRLTLPPWRLPFRTLRWGRFVADDRAGALTWIETDGPQALARAWSPRVTQGSAAVVGDASVAGEAERLTWSPGTTIRADRVASTLFGSLSPLTRLLPQGVRNLTEDKRLSRGRLTDASGTHAGWVVHEEVRW